MGNYYKKENYAVHVMYVCIVSFKMMSVVQIWYFDLFGFISCYCFKIVNKLVNNSPLQKRLSVNKNTCLGYDSNQDSLNHHLLKDSLKRFLIETERFWDRFHVLGAPV